jgi:hypothetical protein
MTQETGTRGRVLSAELAGKLIDYLSFRHFYRHSYSFFLEWEELEKLVTILPEIWSQAKQELNQFLQSLAP